ncbi:MAG: hypothetical protein NW204_08060 [Xanthomonadaceae bacterium]|nr:hypothetical protein [Xanthomonadaceae bacterium]
MKATPTCLALAVALVLLPASHVAQAACSADDFKIEKFEPSEKSRANGRRVYSLRGEVVNKCAEPAAAQIKVEAKNDAGAVVHAEDGWPAGTNNIEPGKAVTFEFGPLFRYDEKIKYFGVKVASAKTW